MKKTPNQILWAVKKICRDNIEVFTEREKSSDYKRMTGARGECRGTVQTCREILGEIRSMERSADQ